MSLATPEAVTSASGSPGVFGQWALTPVSDALPLLGTAAYLGPPPGTRARCALAGMAHDLLSRRAGGRTGARQRIGVHAAGSHAVHMVQHLMLITGAPALLALGHWLALVRESSAHGRGITDLLRHNRLSLW